MSGFCLTAYLLNIKRAADVKKHMAVPVSYTHLDVYKRQAWDSPNGYILASGCDLFGQVKLENIEAFMNAARKYGKWPLDPKNFE